MLEILSAINILYLELVDIGDFYTNNLIKHLKTLALQCYVAKSDGSGLPSAMGKTIWQSFD